MTRRAISSRRSKAEVTYEAFRRAAESHDFELDWLLDFKFEADWNEETGCWDAEEGRVTRQQLVTELRDPACASKVIIHRCLVLMFYKWGSEDAHRGTGSKVGLARKPLESSTRSGPSRERRTTRRRGRSKGRTGEGKV